MFLTIAAWIASTVVVALHGLRQAEDGLKSMRQLQVLLIASEMATRERGPANGVLGDDVPAAPEKQLRLQTARQMTDAAFDNIQRSAPIEDHDDETQTLRQAAQKAYAHLLRARALVDAQANKPRTEREALWIRHAVNEMIGVIDDLNPAIALLSKNASIRFPQAANALMGARQAAMLRELAGQLGSQLTAALTTRQRLTQDEQFTLEHLCGRIEQLRHQLIQDASDQSMRPATRAATDAMVNQYFNSAMPFVELLIEIGKHSGQYPVNTTEFAARYVPEMNSILALRNVLMGEAMGEARQELRNVHRLLLFAALGCMLVLALTTGLWWQLQAKPTATAC
ncbi:nitrate- and nitrite sensing domain-containing protein [Curvibacter sp. CHRR-16]|uniref:hypothetical protein n=1 Tax=Curvibacter sp. CHRR-16 TaxID=2835872 RepID=UPI001BDB2AE4|nr:hypothetical protein [Curvibacter sp. CHRR-16]MBT0569801.1 nitrate- and nitrite sensing domain-containing protein [Curvibacter sp. CHRR-16]